MTSVRSRSGPPSAPPVGAHVSFSRRLTVVAVTGLGGWIVAGGPGCVLGLAVGFLVAPLRARRCERRARRGVDAEIASIFEVAARSVRAGSSAPDALVRTATVTGGVGGRAVTAALEGATVAPSPTSRPAWVAPASGEGGVVRGDHVGVVVVAVLSLVLGTAGGGARGLEAGASLLRDRERTRAEIEAGAAHARASAALLAVVPWVFAVAAAVVLPGPADGVLAHPVATASVAAGVVLQGLGTVWIARLVRSLTGTAP